MVLLKIIFIIFILIFPFAEITRFEFGGGVAITLNEIVLSLLILSWVMFHIFKRKKIRGSLVKPIIIFIAICMLSLLVNIKTLLNLQFLIAFLYLLRWSLYTCIYFLVLDFDLGFKQKIRSFMIFSGTIIVLIGYIQYFFYPNLRNLYYLGWDEHLYRMFSSFLDPNFAGSFFVLLFILILGLIFEYFKKGERKKIILFTILRWVILAAIFLAYSRSAFIMLLTSVFVFLALKERKKWIMLLILLITVFLTIASKNFYIENLNLFRVASSQARIESSLNAIKIIRENPIFGVGFNAYRYAQIRYGFRDIIKTNQSHADAGTDNSFLFVLATTGVIGLISYLYLLILIIKKSLNTYKKNGNLFLQTISAIIISSFIGLFVNSFFINSLFYVFIMEWMWILVGLMENN